MDSLPDSLFQLMLQLARIQNGKRIQDIFLESMNTIFREVTFSLVHEGDETHQDTIEIKTNYNYFGKLALEYGQHILPVSKKNLIYNAVDMLAILLENRKQQEKLAFEKDQIKQKWLKQVENLHERDEQYKALAENSEDMILRFDKHFSIVYANLCSERLFEIPRTFLICKNIQDLEQPVEHKEYWIKNLERVFNLGISIDENLVVNKHSKKTYYNVKFVPEKNEKGDVINVFATARDITELKNKEKALYESQWHLKQAQRIAKIGSWEWNLKYNKISFSEEMYQVLDLVPQENSPSVDELKRYINNDVFEILKAFQEKTPESLGIFEIEINILRADNQLRHCVICGEPIFGSNGKIKKLHGTLQDITERKQMESEIKSAQLKAEESDKLKSAFLANMSHEIRTPLNGILGFSELLKRKNLPNDKRLFYTDIICSNGKQLLKIISDIIDISKIESGQIFLDKSNCQLSQMCMELNTFFNTDLKAKGKTKIDLLLEVDSAFQSLVLTCDEIRLKQVLTNLLSNAVKFTNNGYIKFGYTVKDNWIEFFVCDTGIGIKPEFQKLVFERFRQANEGVSREYGGTGLGLAISKSLVELMGGNIWLTSSEDEGSEFRFLLPLEVSESHPICYSNEMIGQGDYSWPGKKILIVEDDIPSVQLLKETLSDSMAEVLHADDGEKAIEMHMNSKPDIILMDIRLPKMSGLDAIRAIRDADKDVAIIALTANAFVEDRTKCLSAGSNDYISKPVDRKQLLSTINRYIQ